MEVQTAKKKRVERVLPLHIKGEKLRQCFIGTKITNRFWEQNKAFEY